MDYQHVRGHLRPFSNLNSLISGIFLSSFLLINPLKSVGILIQKILGQIAFSRISKGKDRLGIGKFLVMKWISGRNLWNIVNTLIMFFNQYIYRMRKSAVRFRIPSIFMLADFMILRFKISPSMCQLLHAVQWVKLFFENRLKIAPKKKIRRCATLSQWILNITQRCWIFFILFTWWNCVSKIYFLKNEATLRVRTLLCWIKS